jgi:hypothetical protein
MSAETQTDAVTAAINNLLKERMDRYGFDHAEIRIDDDHTGEPALFIDAYYHLGEPLETLQLLRLLTDLRNGLVRQGERRFPYVRHHFNEKQRIAKRK